MLPQLTEAWGAVYFHVLCILFIFALGIPALIYELTVPDDMRRIIHQNLRNKKIILAVVLLAIFAICFIWYLHPCDITANTTKCWMAGILMTIAIVVSIVLWMGVLGNSKRQPVVDRLTKDIERNINRSLPPAEKKIEQLIYLGAKGEPGEEKKMVLEALKKIAMLIQKQDYYDGDKLSQIIQGIYSVIVTYKTDVGGENISKTINILTSIWTNSLNKIIDRDANQIRLTLEKIALLTLEKGNDSQCIKIINSNVADCGMLFRIGKFATQSGKFAVAVAALNKIESKILGSVSINNKEDISNLLGLQAILWTSGKSGKRRVEQIRNASYNFSLNLNMLDQAIEYYYENLDFSTADFLSELKEKTLGDPNFRFVV